MTELSIREYRPEDAPALTALWCSCFEDSEKLVTEFFRLLPRMGAGLTAEADGRLAGMAYALTGFTLTDGNYEKNCGYIYAVAVEKSFRHLGAGRALTKAAAKKAREMGAEMICTLPAEESLYGWYRDILGVKKALCRSKTLIKGEALLPCRRLGHAEYSHIREELLQKTPHVRLSSSCLEFQRILCEEYGGGLFSCGGGIAAAYMDGGKARIKELVCLNEKEREPVAASVCAALGAQSAVLYSSSPEGEAYIAAEPDALPADCVWNLSFD